MSTPEKTVQFTLRLPQETIDALRRVAAKEERTPSAELRLMIRRRIEQDGMQEAA